MSFTWVNIVLCSRKYGYVRPFGSTMVIASYYRLCLHLTHTYVCVGCFLWKSPLSHMSHSLRVCTGPSKPGKSWNLKIWIPGLESSGNFVEVLERSGIWTYRSIFLIISVQEFSRYISSEICVYFCTLKVREFIEQVLEFDIGKSWNPRCQNVYEPCHYRASLWPNCLRGWPQIYSTCVQTRLGYIRKVFHLTSLPLEVALPI